VKQQNYIIGIALSALFCVVCQAQMPGTCDLKGEVQDAPGQPSQASSIELTDLQGQRPYDQVKLNGDNSFSIRNVRCGEYVVRVLDGAGRILRQEYITLQMDSFPVTVRMPKLPAVNRPASGGVSVAELQAPPVPKKAFKAFVRAQEHSQAGRYEKAAAELQKAIKIHPAYGEAHSNLGVQYIRMKQPEKAIEELHKAIEIGPPVAIHYANLSFAYWSLNRFPEAEQAARKALELDPNYLQAHYMLGVVLLPDPRRSAEATEHLQQAASEYPRARLGLAQVYARHGRTDLALNQLQTFEQSAPPESRKMVAQWISQLQAGTRRK
jgi:tetratricopeptide (TPR) repeat protein